MYLFLQLIDKRADTSFMLRNGFSYSQISSFFGEAINEKLIEHVVDLDHPRGMIFILTDQGKEKLAKNKFVLKLGVKANWISQDMQNTCETIGLEEVFLPKKKHSYFDAP